MKNKIVFVGSHLSARRGTKGMAEKIVDKLGSQYHFILTSNKENKLLRLIDIIWTLLFRKYDIVHVDVFSGAALHYAKAAGMIASWRNKQIIMTLHGGRLSEFYEVQPHKVSSVLKYANKLLSPSKFLTYYFKEQEYDVDYLANFIDISKFPYNRSSVQPYSLLWVRAFAKYYNPKLAIDVVNHLRKTYPNIHMTMVGPDKGLMAEAKEHIEKLGIQKYISIIGKVPNEELYKYYQTHAVYLNTTQYESFGVAVVEAASCGIPIVSTKVGEIPYMWIDNEEILLVEDEDSSVMAEKVSQLFEDQNLADKLSKNAKLKAETFSWSHIEPQWHKLFADVMKVG